MQEESIYLILIICITSHLLFLDSREVKIDFILIRKRYNNLEYKK